MDEQQINENKTLSGDDIACPNCGSHNVRCVPYPKVEFGAWFILWLVVAFGGYMISVFITDRGHRVLEHFTGYPAQAEQAGETVHSDAVHHLQRELRCGARFAYERGAAVNDAGLSHQHIRLDAKTESICKRKSSRAVLRALHCRYPYRFDCHKLRGDDRKRICDGAGRRGYDLRLLSGGQRLHR